MRSHVADLPQCDKKDNLAYLRNNKNQSLYGLFIKYSCLNLKYSPLCYILTLFHNKALRDSSTSGDVAIAGWTSAVSGFPAYCNSADVPAETMWVVPFYVRSECKIFDLCGRVIENSDGEYKT